MAQQALAGLLGAYSETSRPKSIIHYCSVSTASTPMPLYKSLLLPFLSSSSFLLLPTLVRFQSFFYSIPYTVRLSYRPVPVFLSLAFFFYFYHQRKKKPFHSLVWSLPVADSDVPCLSSEASKKPFFFCSWHSSRVSIYKGIVHGFPLVLSVVVVSPLWRFHCDGHGSGPALNSPLSHETASLQRRSSQWLSIVILYIPISDRKAHV